MNIDNAKKEMKKETENVNTRLGDDELEQAVGGSGGGLLMHNYNICPKCGTWGQKNSKQQNQSSYKCSNCGHTWSL